MLVQKYVYCTNNLKQTFFQKNLKENKQDKDAYDDWGF